MGQDHPHTSPQCQLPSFDIILYAGGNQWWGSLSEGTQVLSVLALQFLTNL